MNTSTRERSEGRKIYHFPPHDNCKFCRDRHSDTRVESVLRHLKPGEQTPTAGWRLSIILTGSKTREQIQKTGPRAGQHATGGPAWPNRAEEL